VLHRVPVHRRFDRRHPGFTLVELLIAVTILAILSVVVLPQVAGERGEAVISTLSANIVSVTMVLEVERSKGDGSWPAVIPNEWFVGGILPSHPDQLAGMPKLETVSAPAASHPRNKLLVPNTPGAYWYNVARGNFRARVRDQGSVAATLAAYNRINQSALTSLNDTVDPAGAAAGAGAAVTAGAIQGAVAGGLASGR